MSRAPFILVVVAALAPARARAEAEGPDSAERIGPSVVRLGVMENGEERGNGTGFFLRADGLVVTNYHVIDAVSDKLVACLRDGRKVAVLGSVAADEEHDLAIVRVEGAGYPALPLAPSETIRVGQRITLVGSPLGFDQTVSTGIVAALRPDFPDDYKKREARLGRKTAGPLVQHTAPSAPGSSGSPLIDTEGRVVGVNHSGFDGTDLNFAAHVDALRALIARTNLDGKPKRLGPNIRRNLIISAIFFGTLALGLLATYAAGRRRSPRRRLVH